MTDSVVHVATPTREYDVAIGKSIVEQRLATTASTLDRAERAVLVTDTGVPQKWIEAAASGLEEAGLAVTVLAFEQGEPSKTLHTCSKLLAQMARSGLHRRDVVVGLGGGVVTDIAGFLASVYMRGVELFQVPTTLLGMVDAAIGGKTGVNLEGWKNLVGTFYPPAVVVCDVATLETLPARELRNGLAEVIKYGFISKPEILHSVSDLTSGFVGGGEGFVAGEATVALVRDCAEVKASVVSVDEKESGVREILNFGHTLGHALERATANELSHGEAISIGMVFEAELSALTLDSEPSLAGEVRGNLTRAGLPTSVEEASQHVAKEAVFEAMAMDKKYRGGVRFVMLESVANPVVSTVDDSRKIEAALARVGIE